jgi:hypothetical protein
MRESKFEQSQDGEVGARALGLASIGIGLTELAAPKKVEQMMGIGNGENTGILRVLGVREIMHGIDILTHRDPNPGVWSRVAGDVLDGVLLAIAAKKTKRPASFAMVSAMVLGIVALDVKYARQTS